MNRSKGAVIASAAATLILTGAASVRSDVQTQNSTEEKIMCAGINTCNGKGVCKSAQTTCRGLNSCEGKGLVLVTQKDCVCQGGSSTRRWTCLARPVTEQ